MNYAKNERRKKNEDREKKTDSTHIITQRREVCKSHTITHRNSENNEYFDGIKRRTDINESVLQRMSVHIMRAPTSIDHIYALQSTRIEQTNNNNQLLGALNDSRIHPESLMYSRRAE